MANAEFDSQEWREERDKRLLEWFLGNEDAVRCYVTLSSIGETWDDLIDKDKEITNKEINAAFLNALVFLQNNPFYVSYRAFLEPVLIISINAWFDSDILQKSDNGKWRMLAFYLRNYDSELAQACAFCVGGFEQMRKVSIDIRQLLNPESYDQWEHAMRRDK